MGFSKVSSRGVCAGVFGPCNPCWKMQMQTPAWNWFSGLFSKSLNYGSQYIGSLHLHFWVSLEDCISWCVCYSSELLFLLCTRDQLYLTGKSFPFSVNSWWSLSLYAVKSLIRLSWLWSIWFNFSVQGQSVLLMEKQSPICPTCRWQWC